MYLEKEKGEILIMIKAYKQFWKKYFNFKGVSTRSEFWWVFLINSLISLVFIVAFGGVALVTGIVTGHGPKEVGIAAIIGLIVAVVYYIAAIIPTISLHFRRYRDAGVTPWLLLITYGVPFIIEGSTFYDKHAWVQAVILIIAIINFVILVMPSKDRK